MSKLDTFLNAVGSIIEDQIPIGENKNHSLDLIENGKVIKYGKLGDFANRIDTTTTRKYYEQGLTYYNSAPKSQEFITQKPEITIYIKKKFVSSISNNYRTDLMSKDDKIFLKASKVLFRNKCRQIAAYERLFKVSEYVANQNRIEESLTSILYGALVELQESSPNSEISDPKARKLKEKIDSVRNIINFSQESLNTSWVMPSEDFLSLSRGDGTGVIELTLVKSFNCSNSIKFDSGSASLQIEDPYNLFKIKQEDIEKAISDTLLEGKSGSTFLTAANNALKQTIAQDIKSLNQARVLRGANELNFIVSPKTLLGNRIRVIIDGIGEEIKFTYGSSVLDGSSVLGSLFSQIAGGNANITVDGDYIIPTTGEDFDNLNLGLNRLSQGKIINTFKKPQSDIENTINGFVNTFSNIPSSNELDILKRILSNYYLALQQEELTKINKIEVNKSTNKLRQKLMDYYCGRLIIQPMDTVHAYIRSNMQTDPKLSLYIKNDFGPSQIIDQIGKTINNIKSYFSSSGDLSSNLEKSIFVGSDFPEYIWKNMRNQIVGDKIGTHVFAGIVKGSTSAINPRQNTVSVSIESNAGYFKMGLVNINPSIDDSYNSLYDPLTPFEIEFDSVNGTIDSLPKLLEENVQILNSAFLRFSSGRNAGRIPNENNIQQDIELSYSNKLRNIFHAPPGFVYEWKKGIGVYTGFQQSTKYKSSLEKPKAPQITKDAFAGQDVMNSLSLFITGQPYNFVTFYKAVRDFDQYNNNDQNNQDASVSFTKQLQLNLEERNNQYGRFIPFKKLSLSEELVSKYYSRQFSIIDTNTKINELLKQRAKLVDLKLTIESLYPESQGAPNNSTDIAGLFDYKAAIQELDNKIFNVQNTSEFNTNSDSIIKIAGDDISFDTDEFINTFDQSVLTDTDARKLLRRKINFLSRRLPWQVKGNTDRNFFIVDDSYDKDYDLQAFESLIDSSKLSTFNSQFTTIHDKIVQTASILQLECFIDTQGNIQVRPPQYNKIPSSIFNKLFKLNKEEGIRLFPKFLEDLYTNQIDATCTSIEVCEDNIRLFCAILGLNTDISSQEYISSNGPGVGDNFFYFTSDESTGKIFSKGSIKELLVYSSPEQQETNLQTLESVNDVVNTQSGLPSVFNFVKRLQIATNNFGEGNYNFTNKINTSSDRILSLTERIYRVTRQTIDTKKYLVESQKLGSKGVLSNVDLLNINNQISYYVGQRQRLLKTLNGLLKTVTDTYDSNNPDTINSLLEPNAYDQDNIPSIFENLIEDEEYDDYGPGSGKRYIIKNYQIKSGSFQENVPQNTVIEVNARISPQLAQEAVPSGTSITLPGGVGGNLVTSAIAVDYDLWRMYGFRSTESISPIFFTNPVTQCAPFAVSLLNKQHSEILTGSITIVGNEFMQPGEVYFIEEDNMLYYTESVSHSFSYGSDFTTTLELRYGHNPGKYIPNPLDIIGKILYNNKNNDDLIVIKNDNYGSETPLGTLIKLDSYYLGSDPNSSETKNKYKINNDKVIDSIKYSALNMISTSNEKSKPIIELRLYSKNIDADEELYNLAEYFVKLLTGKIVSDKDKANAILIPEENVRINIISTITNKNNFATLSKNGFSIAKDLYNEKNSSNNISSVTYSNKIDDIISKNIIDVWLIYA